jgi:hypothetical protein
LAVKEELTTERRERKNLCDLCVLAVIFPLSSCSLDVAQGYRFNVSGWDSILFHRAPPENCSFDLARKLQIMKSLPA